MKQNNLWLRLPRSSKNRLRVDDIAPDGVPITVKWDEVVVNSSIFVPCINTVELVRQVFEVARRRGWTLQFRPRVEGGKWGVRFWRVL
jgi:hypothetical protein